MSWQDVLIQQLINGLTIGMVYALIALGYTMIYGIIQLINFAHGEIFMVGAYLGLTIISAHQCTSAPVTSILAIFIFAMLGCGILGVAIDTVAYRPLRSAPRLCCLITAIGVSFFLQNAVMLIFGASDKYFPNVLNSFRISIGRINLTGMQGLIIVFSILLMVALHLFVMHTKLGKAMRAVAGDHKAASLMGIDVHGIIRFAFFIGSMLAGAAGVMFGMYYNTINFHDGYLMGIKAFTAAVFGGIGNIPGAMIGGVLLGLIEGLCAGYISSQWKNVFAFALLILILLFKPSGILGERVAERA